MLSSVRRLMEEERKCSNPCSKLSKWVHTTSREQTGEKPTSLPLKRLQSSKPPKLDIAGPQSYLRQLMLMHGTLISREARRTLRGSLDRSGQLRARHD